MLLCSFAFLSLLFYFSFTFLFRFLLPLYFFITFCNYLFRFSAVFISSTTTYLLCDKLIQQLCVPWIGFLIEQRQRERERGCNFGSLNFVVCLFLAINLLSEIGHIMKCFTRSKYELWTNKLPMFDFGFFFLWPTNKTLFALANWQPLYGIRIAGGMDVFFCVIISFQRWSLFHLIKDWLTKKGAKNKPQNGVAGYERSWHIKT